MSRMSSKNGLAKSKKPPMYNGYVNGINTSDALMLYPIKEASTIMDQPKKGTRFIYPYRFAYGFLNCCEDCRLCALGTYCLPCFLYCLYIDANEPRCSACAQCFFGLTPLGCCFSNLSIMRTKFRGTFRLHGSIMEDTLYSYLLPCCAAIQMYQELKAQGEQVDYPGSKNSMMRS